MSHLDIYYDQLQTPIGVLTLVGTVEELFRIDFDNFSKNEIKIKDYLTKANLPIRITKREIDHPLKDELIDYFKGALTMFSIPQTLFGTEFQKEVWQALGDIPYGQTITYQQLAKIINRPKAIRAVGGALNKNPFSIVLPCHRVIGSDGSLTGFGGGLKRKEQLLLFEQENKLSF